MTLLETMTREIVGACLPGVLIDDDDRRLIAEHRDLLLGIEDDLVDAFFDAVGAQERSAAIVRSADRDGLEASLRRWWQATVTGDLGEGYLRAMALVGIVHVRAGVSNTMTLAMLQVMRDVFTRRVMPKLTIEDATELSTALANVQATVGALITQANTRAQTLALGRLSGLRPWLIEGMVTLELGSLVDRTRGTEEAG